MSFKTTIALNFLAFFTRLVLSQQQSSNQASNQNQIQNNTQCTIQNCHQCVDGDPLTCQKCDQFFALTDGYCVWCPKNPKTKDVQTCSLCDNTCMNCNVFTAQCLQCLPGFQLIPTQAHGPKCEHCEVNNCAICPNIDDCLQCESGFMLQIQPFKCVQCTDYYCDKCNDSPSICSVCAQGYQLKNDSTCQEMNVECEVGYYQSITENTCKSCPDGCNECLDDKICLDCSSGYYMPIINLNTFSNKCLPCSSKCFQCKYISNHCTSCYTGATLPFYGNCNSKCLNGYYLSDETQQCAMCPANCAQCSSKTKCTSCQMHGFYQLQNGECLRVCPSGQFEYYDQLASFIQQEAQNQLNQGLNNTLAQNHLIDVQTAKLLFIKYPYEIQLFTQNLQCKPCDTSCGECLFFSNHCIGCNTNTTLDITNYQCKATCDTDSYSSYSWVYSTQVCRKCVLPCTKCSGANTCLECSPPYQVVQGICQFKGVESTVDDYCANNLFFFQDYCYPQCPRGLIQQSPPNSCTCPFSCKTCAYDLQQDHLQCLACKSATDYIWNYQCVPQCPLGTFTYPNIHNSTSDLQKQVSKGLCLAACPAQTWILIDYQSTSITQTCVQQCPHDHKLIINKCIPDVCGLGYYEDYNQIQSFDQLEANNTNDSYETWLNRLKSSVCIACPQDCLTCTQQECTRCSQGLFLDVQLNQCVKQCQSWQMIQQLSDSQAQCIPCKYGCNLCQEGMILYQGNCYDFCYPADNNTWCFNGVQAQSEFKGIGSALGYLSSLDQINLYWSVNQTNQSTLIKIQNVTCNIETFDSQTMNLLESRFITYKQLPITVNSTNDIINITLKFGRDFFGDDQKIRSTCRSIMEFDKDLDKTLFYITESHFFTFPLPNGKFTVRRQKPNTFYFILDGFNPQFGPSAENYLNQKGVYLTTDSQINITKVEEEIYRPYNYQVVYENTCNQWTKATYTNPQVPVWSFTSFDYLENKTFQSKFDVAEDTCFRFELRVWNEWTPQVEYQSNTFIVSPVGDAANVEYYVNKLHSSNASSIKSIIHQMKEKFIAMQNNHESNYCFYGQLNKTTHQCMCLKQQNHQYIKDYVNKTKTALKVIQQLFQKYDPEIFIQGASDLLVYYTNNTCALVDQSMLEMTANLILDLLAKKAQLTQYAITNLIISIINIHDSWSYLSMSGNRRILDRLQAESVNYLGPGVKNSQKNPIGQTSPINISNLRYSVEDVDMMLQAALFILSEKTTNEIHIQQGQIELIMYTIQKSSNPLSSYDFMLGNIAVHLPFSSTSDYIKQDDKLTLMLIRKTQESWMMNPGIKLLDDQYIQSNIISQKHGKIFSSSTSNFKIYFTFFDKSLLGSESCVYYNKEQSFWSTQLVSTIAQVGRIQCQSDHLSEFSVSQSSGMTNNLYVVRQMNTQIGWLNLFIVFISLFGSLMLFCLIEHCICDDSNRKNKQKSQTVIIKQANDEHNVSIEKVLDKVRQVKRRPSLEDEIEVLEFEKDIVKKDVEQIDNPKQENHRKVKSDQPLMFDEIKINSAPTIVEFESQSQQQIIMSETVTMDHTKMLRWHLYNYIFCIFTKPQSWAPSSLRICVIFLWFSCYELIFAAILTKFGSSQITQDLTNVSIATLIVSNFANYFLALIVFTVCKCFNSFEVVVKTPIIIFLIAMNLGLVIFIYSTLPIENLSSIHAQNALIQIVFNMLLFDLLMEAISKYPGIKTLRTMRNFKLMEFE